MINTEAFADTTNVSMPVDANVLQFVTTGGSPASLKTLNKRSLDYIGNTLVVGDAGPFTNSTSLRCLKVDGNGAVNIRFTSTTLNTTGEFTLAFWIIAQQSGQFKGDGITIGILNDIAKFGLSGGLYSIIGITKNTWHYLAVCRDSQGVCYTYVDGNLTRTFDYANKTFDISAYTSTGDTSYLYDVIMTNQCMFTGNFTPPIAGVINGG